MRSKSAPSQERNQRRPAILLDADCFMVPVAQSALGDEGHDSVAVNFFGDGTANNGAPPRAPPGVAADDRVVWPSATTLT